MAIDARENINAQIAIARNLGGDIGSIFGYRQREQREKKRRERMQSAMVQILNDPNLTTDEKRRSMLMTSDMLQSGIGEELLQAELGIGRYYQDPLDKKYKKAQIKDIKSRTKSRQAGIGGFGGRGIGAGATGQGNLLTQLKYYQDGLNKALTGSTADEAENDPQVRWFQARIKELQLQLNPPQVDQDWLQSEGFQEGEFQQPAPAREPLTTAEELIAPPAGARRDLTMQGAFGKPDLVGPPASAQTSFPVTPSLEKRSSPAKPKSKEEFLATVARLKASPDTAERARAYYDKWIGKFKWQ